MIGGNTQAPPPVTCYLINSTYGGIDKNAFNEGVIYVGWHLTISVESEGQPIEGANVEAYYLHNSSLAEQKATQNNGKVQFDLMEWKITELGSQYVGDYKVRVSYGTSQTEEVVTMSSSKQIVISEFPDNTPPFPTTLIVAAIVSIVIVGAALLVYFVKVKKTTGEAEKVTPEGVM